MREWQCRSVTVLGLLVTAPIPLVLVVALRGDFAWYEGAALFYAMVAAAQIAYLGLLLVVRRRDRRQVVSVLS